MLRRAGDDDMLRQAKATASTLGANAPVQDDTSPIASPSFGTACRTWLRIAALSFGGPAGQIAVMHRILVEELRWVSEARFLHALNYCMLLPGPEAQQLATYFGWLLHGVRGGLTAGLLFVLPGYLSILALSLIDYAYGDAAIVAGLFYGLKPAIVAVVLHAVVRVGKRALHSRTLVLIAVAAFAAIHVWGVPFPLIVAAAALAGVVLNRWNPLLVTGGGAHGPSAKVTAPAGETLLGDGDLAATAPSWLRTAGVAALWLAIWWAPIGLLAAAWGPHSIFVREATFFSKTALVTFGGAYSVLSYVAAQCVENFGWLTPGEMLDGLGLAETTPGPLIQVVQWVAFHGAVRNPAPLTPLAAGLVGSVVATWVTYAPCFLWIFVGAPYMERLRNKAPLAAALSAITAAVTGAILNLSIWFAWHALFRQVNEVRYGPARLNVPQWNTLDPAALAIAVGAAVAIFRWRWGVLRTIAVAACAGCVWQAWS